MRLRLPRFLTLALALAAVPLTGNAFCGFYVARADTSLYNRASQVVLVRDDDRTVITMASDFHGDVNDFAMVVPVPVIPEREQIHVTDRAIIQHLDAYTAPRLVEYFDDDPCRHLHRLEEFARADMMMAPAAAGAKRARQLGVTIEAEYTVGEYDIVILSAKQSDGLTTWLTENGYRLPDGAGPVIRSYLKQNMRFFVARVNLGEQQRLGYKYLRPLQIAYESPKFMLPIRLGTVNAEGKQELYVYALTRKGRVETRNYRTVKMPTGMTLPASIKDDFAGFYRAMFTEQTRRNNDNAVFLEYAWDMNWCDPCAADPLSDAELAELGVFWLDKGQRGRSPARDVFVTRLHVSYDRAHFPEDLMLATTGDRSNFQGRYVIRHPWKGRSRCDAAETYRNVELPKRRRVAAGELAALTGWDIRTIHDDMGLPAGNVPE
ncbi:MAG: DUF2330 domain-containing protein, partial [Gammaproteobacteria bacterium]|nr:DUF2330 domain-containing protein [Gammaproteobacteria bacterium]